MENVESTFNRQASMNFEKEEPMRIAIQLRSVSYLQMYTAIIASIKTPKKDETPWTHVNTHFIEEQNRVTEIGDCKRIASTDEGGTLASS